MRLAKGGSVVIPFPSLVRSWYEVLPMPSAKYRRKMFGGGTLARA